MAIDANAEASWHPVIPTALGALTLVRNANALLGLYYPHHWYMPRRETFGPLSKHGFEDVTEQLAECLAVQRRDFDLPLATRSSERYLLALEQADPAPPTPTHSEHARPLRLW